MRSSTIGRKGGLSDDCASGSNVHSFGETGLLLTTREFRLRETGRETTARAGKTRALGTRAKRSPCAELGSLSLHTASSLRTQ